MRVKETLRTYGSAYRRGFHGLRVGLWCTFTSTLGLVMLTVIFPLSILASRKSAKHKGVADAAKCSGAAGGRGPDGLRLQ